MACQRKTDVFYTENITKTWFDFCLRQTRKQAELNFFEGNKKGVWISLHVSL
jgi:hypothetical protein